MRIKYDTSYRTSVNHNKITLCENLITSSMALFRIHNIYLCLSVVGFLQTFDYNPHCVNTQTVFGTTPITAEGMDKVNQLKPFINISGS